MKRWFSALLCVCILLTALAGCGANAAGAPASASMAPAPSDEPVVLTVAGPWDEFPALESAAAKFTALYPNCTIQYEGLQNYSESLVTRLEQSTNKIDLFVSSNILPDNPLFSYVYDFYSADSKLDLSGTFAGLIDNFTVHSATGDADQLYCIPMGGEVRGMYVNTTLLDSLGIAVPNSRTELLAACGKLKAAGYIPMQGNPSTFASALLYPSICNSLINGPDAASRYEMVSTRADGVAELFRDEMEFSYSLPANDYYNYKYAQDELNLFNDTTNEGLAYSFLNIVDDNGTYKKLDDVGQVAFFPFLLSLGSTLERVRNDYHSTIEYTFILSPVGEDGEGCAYLSPADGLALNKASDNIEWTMLFLNFLFTPENNKPFAEQMGVIPNTTDAREIMAQQFNVDDAHVCDLGQVTFGYNFYGTVTTPLRDAAKGNNPKYMQDNGDGTYTMYDVEYYMQQLEEAFATATELTT